MYHAFTLVFSLVWEKLGYDAKSIIPLPLSSICSGLVASSLGTPADVMKTRMMNQPYRNGRGVYYKSTLDCLVQTVSVGVIRVCEKPYHGIYIGKIFYLLLMGKLMKESVIQPSEA